MDVTSDRPATARPLRIGTRGSKLARWQSDWVAAELRRHHPELTVEVVEIRTLGDRDRNSPLAAIGGAGLFTKEIQVALAEGRVDLAVHSLKDLPTNGPPSLVLAAVPPREASGDALIAPVHQTLAALPAGAKVGTSSLRRRALLLHARPDLRVMNLRGNVETRLNAALGGELDAVVLAEAGLARLGLSGHVTDRLGPPAFLPAVGQGALGLECRADDAETLARVSALDDPATHRAVLAERTLLAALGGGCVVPMCARAQVDPDGRLTLEAAVLDSDGRERIDLTEGPDDDTEALARRAARQLIARGAARLLGTEPPPASGSP